MRITSKTGGRWKAFLAILPLVIVVALAIATSSFISAGSAVYLNYGVTVPTAAPSEYGIGDNMLFVANGSGSDVKVIDVGTMSIVDTIPVPVQPNGLAGLGMVWEIHGVVPSQDRASVYAVGALSGGYLAGAPYQMYQISAGGDGPKGTVERAIPLATNATNPVGYCGLEYNLNNESSSEIIATSMNAADATLMSIGAPSLGRAPADQTGGWAYEDISTGTATGFLSADFNGNLESSTCGISWSANGTRAQASQMFEPLVDTIDWTYRTVDGNVGPATNGQGAGNSYHQSTVDKARGYNYVTSENGYIDVFDINTGVLVGSIDVRALTGSTTNAVHSIDLSPNNSNIAYVTSRNTPDNGDNMELVIDVADINAPVMKGSIGGFADGVCGVYATGDKAAYYGTMPSGLTLSKTAVYWGSYADYTAGLLSVDYSIGNTGAAAEVNIVGAVSTGGVTLASPASVGVIASGGSAPVTLQYNVPGGTTGFMTTVYATAQNGSQMISLPGPYPGS